MSEYLYVISIGTVPGVERLLMWVLLTEDPRPHPFLETVYKS